MEIFVDNCFAYHRNSNVFEAAQIAIGAERQTLFSCCLVTATWSNNVPTLEYDNMYSTLLRLHKLASLENTRPPIRLPQPPLTAPGVIYRDHHRLVRRRVNMPSPGRYWCFPRPQ